MDIISLISRGSPAQMTGGHIYHRRMAEFAPAHGAVVERITACGLRDPLHRARGVVLVDSLRAWTVVPWLLRAGNRRRPIAAIVHQAPGGVDHGRIRTAFQRPLDLTLYRRCDLLVATGHSFAHELTDRWRLPAERIRVVEPGCDIPDAVAAPDEDRVLRLGRHLALLNVANWWPNKGVLELLDAVATLPRDCVTLHLVGREDVHPRYSRRVHERLRAADLAGRVVAHGPLAPAQLGPLYAGADAFVSASAGETYGMVYAEALAAGLPIVGWRAGALPELVEDGREGCLVPPGDVGGLGRALERLSTDEAWRHRLAAAARERGAALPTWSESAAGFFAALSQLAGCRG